jgi:hypothetical protein
MSPARPTRIRRSTRPRRLTEKELEAKRNMCELMRDMGCADRFDNPDEWLKSIIERPRCRSAG